MEMELCSQSFCNEGDTSSVLSVRFSPLRTGQQLFQDLDDLACYRALGSIERVGAVLKAADACHEMWLKNGSHCATDEQWPDDTTNEYYTLSRAVRALREKPTEEKPERKSRDDILVEAAKNVQRACAGIITALTQRPDDR